VTDGGLAGSRTAEQRRPTAARREKWIVECEIGRAGTRYRRRARVSVSPRGAGPSGLAEIAASSATNGQRYRNEGESQPPTSAAGVWVSVYIAEALVSGLAGDVGNNRNVAPKFAENAGEGQHHTGDDPGESMATSRV